MSTRIRSVEFEPLNIALIEPFVIAIGRLDEVKNVLVTVTLENGAIGYGEAAPLEPINGENQATILATLQTCAELLKGQDALEWRKLSKKLAGVFWAQAAARCGLEMALLDAVTKTMRVPLYQFFGGATDRVETDISIPIVTPERGRELASEIQERGVRTIKIKVGSGIAADVARVVAIQEGAPLCRLTIDANQGYSASEAVELLRDLRASGIYVSLFEQPVPKHDQRGLKFVTEQGGVPVAGDEAVFYAAHAYHLAAASAANVVNIKLMKSGLVEAMDIAAVCRASHTRLMIGGMIESRLAMGCSAHFAAGNGGFDFVDLDTPLLLADDPFEGGYLVEGGTYLLSHIRAGHGCYPKGRPSGEI
jgi:L-Ala-D/L-Glu epimerase